MDLRSSLEDAGGAGRVTGAQRALLVALVRELQAAYQGDQRLTLLA